MQKPMIGRFAPSPSGRMHLGNVLCALLAWLSARSQNGGYILRIEDLDTMRCPRSFAALIVDDLKWLGLDWDGIGEQNPGALRYAEALADIPESVRRSAYQSDRTPIYEYFEGILRGKGLLYPCFCSRAELHAANAPHLSDGRVVYPGTCPWTDSGGSRCAPEKARGSDARARARTKRSGLWMAVWVAIANT